MPIVGLTSQLTAERDRDMRQMISNTHYERAQDLRKGGGHRGPHPQTTCLQWNSWCMGTQAMGPAFWILSISSHACGAWLYSARYRTAPGWTGAGRDRSLNPTSVCNSFYLSLSTWTTGITLHEWILGNGYDSKPGCRNQWFGLPIMEHI